MFGPMGFVAANALAKRHPCGRRPGSTLFGKLTRYACGSLNRQIVRADSRAMITMAAATAQAARQAVRTGPIMVASNRLRQGRHPKRRVMNNIRLVVEPFYTEPADLAVCDKIGPRFKAKRCVLLGHGRHPRSRSNWPEISGNEEAATSSPESTRGAQIVTVRRTPLSTEAESRQRDRPAPAINQGRSTARRTRRAAFQSIVSTNHREATACRAKQRTTGDAPDRHGSVPRRSI